MPNKRSAAKELRKAKKRHSKNLRMQTHMKQLYKRAEKLLKEGDRTAAKEAVKSFQQSADKAAKVRAVSPNSANRRKARLMAALTQAK